MRTIALLACIPMSLIEMQRALSVILTSPGVRHEYQRDPDFALRQFSLTERERTTLAALDSGRLQRYSAMLIAGRLELALKALPVTRLLLPADFTMKFGELYSRDYPPVILAGSAMLHEVHSIRQFITDLTQSQVLNDPYLCNVVRFEASVFHLTNDIEAFSAATRCHQELVTPVTDTTRPLLERHVLICTFDSDILAILNALRHGRRPEEHLLSSTTILLLRRNVDTPAVSIIRLNEASRELLQKCDGATDIRELSRLYSDRIVDVLDRFVQSHIIAMLAAEEALPTAALSTGI